MANAWCATGALCRRRTRWCRRFCKQEERARMKILIAGQDYSAALDAAHPLEIARKLNEPSTCVFALSLPCDGSLAPPARMAAVAVTGDDGTIYFTGYLAGAPTP